MLWISTKFNNSLIKDTNIKTIYDENNSEENDILKNIQTETNTSIEILDNMIANFDNNSYLDLLKSNLEKMKKSIKNLILYTFLLYIYI